MPHVRSPVTGYTQVEPPDQLAESPHLPAGFWSGNWTKISPNNGSEILGVTTVTFMIFNDYPRATSKPSHYGYDFDAKWLLY